MTSPFHLALAVLVAWFTLAASAFLIKQRQFFGAWLCWWTGLSFLQYSYAGEKVPWLSVHIVLPLLLTTGYLAGLCWERSRDLSHLPHLRRRDLLTALCLLAVGLNFFQGYRLNFFNAENPAEILVYNHTQSAFRDFAHRMRADAKVDKSLPPRALVQGEPTWPLLWYMRGTHYVFSGPDALPEEYIQMQYIACDESYLDAFPVLREQFDIRQVDFRRHWFPERLHLMQPIRNALLDKYGNVPPQSEWTREDYAYMEAARWQYGRGAWRSLWRYVWWREMWGNEPFTAMPMTVPVGRRKSE